MQSDKEHYPYVDCHTQPTSLSSSPIPRRQIESLPGTPTQDTRGQPVSLPVTPTQDREEETQDTLNNKILGKRSSDTYDPTTRKKRRELCIKAASILTTVLAQELEDASTTSNVDSIKSVSDALYGVLQLTWEK
ncbi:hypothetical protein K435DRAFT_904773 [Dendrothele bispora CBS 962.96]|uniref:Uncharacterized protein n=1 Tax=Dendrothele bispora (strain CBS 962.96) TaxID=1314807 RepID=A0A4S8KKH0_DENBC|nr:hypothetical protein K435DRAFT_904773 [Dendrothele bispora CBS 962.96]